MKIGISGCSGRMGQLLVKEIISQKDLYLAGGIARQDGFLPDNVPILKNPEDLVAISDVIIDFSAPDAGLLLARIAAQIKKPLVIGTTGFTENQLRELQDCGQKSPLLLTPNSSLGVNMMLEAVELLSRKLGVDFEIEITEAHHNKKVDAPSGTALALGQAAAKGRLSDLSKHSVYARQGKTGARSPDEIGFSVIRGGDIVGEHTVYFIGQGERLEITHRATDRTLFARGAIQAARWLINQPAGFYSMQDFLKAA
jgi:4-hydroxy-tetrahydrodipicolinate reductase